MTTVWIPQGFPASGKSTWARSLNVMRFNLDDYRFMMWGGSETTWNKQNEYVAQQAAMQGLLAAVKEGRDCVWDNTNLVPAPLKRIKSLLYLHPEVEFQVASFMHVPIEECIERDARREKPVGEEVIRRLEKSYKSASKSGWKLTDEWMNERFTPTVYVPDLDLPDCILVDIDGTTAMKGDRSPYDFANCHLDTLNESIKYVMDAVQHSNGYVAPDLRTRFIFLSGRGEEFREQTEKWLLVNEIHYDELHMRPAGDQRPDYIIKHELFDQHVRNRFRVRMSWDDRGQVVNLWRQMGLACWEINKGDF